MFKKLLTIFLVFISVFLLVSCKSGEKDPTNDPTKDPETKEISEIKASSKSKLEYEDSNIDGLVIEIIYNNGEKEELNVTNELIQTDLTTLKDGNKLRGISKDKICVAVATDGFQTIILSENTSKPSSKSTLDTMKCHIKPKSKLIHDGEHSHQVLIDELNLEEEFVKSSYQEYLNEKDNPLTPINKIHSYIKKFMRNHEGFSRDNLQDWMNLISFILNDPENRYDKLKIFLKLAISSPKRVKYRDVMSKK